jgi:hypothetical protein
MIIAALVRLFKKIKTNTKMSKAAKTSPVAKPYEYEKATFVSFDNTSITVSYTYMGKTATVKHNLTPNQNLRFTYIYTNYINKITNKLNTGKIFAAINNTTGQIDYLFWESTNNGKKVKIYF